MTKPVSNRCDGARHQLGMLFSENFVVWSEPCRRDHLRRAKGWWTFGYISGWVYWLGELELVRNVNTTFCCSCSKMPYWPVQILGLIPCTILATIEGSYGTSPSHAECLEHGRSCAVVVPKRSQAAQRRSRRTISRRSELRFGNLRTVTALDNRVV